MEKEKKFISKMGELKCRLPQIKELDIAPLLSEYSPSLNQFLLECMPPSLTSLSINWDNRTRNAPADLYCDGLARAVTSATKEVFLADLAMSGPTFEAIVKAASQTEKLTFHNCTIDSSGDLDLDGPSEYR